MFSLQMRLSFIKQYWRFYVQYTPHINYFVLLVIASPFSLSKFLRYDDAEYKISKLYSEALNFFW